MVGYYYKTGAEIYSILRFMKNSLNLPYIPSAGSIEVVKMYADKKYRFSFFLNERKEIVYLIEQLGDGTTNYSKEEKEMTKEEALKKIEDLKEYVEKCEEKEKEIPKMQTNCLRDVNQCEIKAGLCSNFNRYITFQHQDTNAIWAIMSIELAHLLYCREYLGVLDHLTWANWKVDFDKHTCEYKVYSYVQTSAFVDTSNIVPEFMWYFENKDDAQRICDYMNKYVAHVKKNMF